MAKRKGMPRGMYQRGAVYYSCIAGPERRMIRKRLSADYQTAKTILASMRRDIDLQRAGLIESSPTVRVSTLEAVREKYVGHMMSGQNSDQTVAIFQNSWSQVVHKNQFVYLSDITLTKVENWVKQRLEEGKVRGQSLNIYVGHVYRALDWARKSNLICSNPLAHWSAVRVNQSRLRRDLNPDEINAILNAEEDREWQTRWYVYLFTGLRKTAGAALRWEWIDWEKRLLHLPTEYNKSRKPLDLPLHDQFYGVLKDWNVACGSPDSGPMFSAVRPLTINKHLARTCQRAGVDAAGVTVHSFRHTFATMVYVTADKNIKAVQELLGHASAATSLRYLHVSAEEKKAAINKLDYKIGQ